MKERINKHNSVQNKTAFITGATSGIGEATAKHFSREGIKLVLCGRNKDKLEKLQSEFHTNVNTLCFDVTSSAEVEKAIDSLPNDFSKIDILINNAGNAHGLDPIQKGDVEDWDKMKNEPPMFTRDLIVCRQKILPISYTLLYQGRTM